MPSSPWCFSMCPPVHWLMMASSAKVDGTDGHALSASPSKLPRILAKSSVVSKGKGKGQESDRYNASPGYGEGIQKLSLEGSGRLTTVKSDDEDGPEPRSSSSSSSCHLSLSSSEGSVAWTNKKRRDEDDRYPCLRRALSCTETPILPLGTYALEFGFDVTCLPFAGFSHGAGPRNVVLDAEDGRQLLSIDQKPSMASAPAKEANDLNSMWTAQCSDRSQSSLVSEEGIMSVPNNLSASGKRHATLRSTLNQPGKCHGHNASSNKHGDAESPVDDRKDRCVAQCKYNQRRRRTLTPRKQQTSEDCRNTANYFLAENTRLSEIEEEMSPVSSGDSGHVRNGLVTDMGKAPESGSVRTNVSSMDSDRREDFVAGDRKYASVYKKDSRTWLWKSSAKKSSSEMDGDLALKWKKDNRKWLWKSSWKKETCRSRICDDRS